MDAVNGQLISTGTTAATPINITDAYTKSAPVTHWIEIVTGTVKVGIGSVDANAHGFAAGSKVPVTCYPGHLYVQQAAGADNFVVTV